MYRILWIGLALSGCASLNTTLPSIESDVETSEEDHQITLAIEATETLRARFHTIANRILTANVDLCERTGPFLGVVTQSIEDYPEAMQDQVALLLGLDEDPRVTFVADASPAQAAGIQVGDRFLDANGDIVSPAGKAVQSRLETGESLTVQSGDQSRDIQIEPHQRCDYRLKLKMSPQINAYATGKSIVMTAGMMNFAVSDDELAYVIGHELAHNTQGHVRKIITNYVLSGFSTRHTRQFESEADYVGLYYAARAGYDIDGVEDMWRRLARQSVKPIYRAKTHPTYPNRFVQIQATRDEINHKKSASVPLIPNFKSDPETGS